MVRRGEAGMDIITDPVKALVEIGKENSSLHEELARCYSELDRYRDALTEIAAAPGLPGKIARKALGKRGH